jgi:hypothetical protein
MSPERTGENTVVMSPSSTDVDGHEVGSPHELVIGESVGLKLTDDGLVISGE